MPALATPQLPSSGSILSGGVPGTSAKRPRRMGGAGGPAPSMAPNSQQQQAGQPQAPPETFAQLQQSGRARPAPPSPPPMGGGAVQGSQTPGGGGSMPPSMMGGQHSTQPPPQAGVSSAGPLQQQLASSLRSSLANPNPYNSDTVRSIDSALTGQLNQDYGAQRKHLEEDLSRRGLSASTIGGGYYGDLQGQQDQALATMRAGLTQSAANAEIAGRTQAQGAAQSNINAQNSQGLSEQQLALQQLLGQGNLDVSRGQLDLAKTGQAQQYGLAQNAQDIQKDQFGKTLGLSQQQQDLARELGLGNLNLNRDQLTQQNSQFNQDFGLRKESAADQRSQFQKQLEQQLGIATMSDKTANRGIDSSASQQQLDYLLRLAGITGIGGLGGGSSTSGYGGTGGTSGTGGTNGPGGNTSGYGDVALDAGGNADLNDQTTLDFLENAYRAFYPGQKPTNGASLQAWYARDKDKIQQWARTQGGYNSTTTVNFGGKQYTQQEFEQLKQQHPELFGPRTAFQNQGDLSYLSKPKDWTQNPQTWQQYAGTPVPDNSPFNQQFWDTHTPEQAQAEIEKYNFNTAKNDAANALHSMVGAGGVFRDQDPGVGGNDAWRQGSQTTQEYINQKLREAGYNPDGTRIRS